jgi:seryl-tRNA synthetase
MNYSDKLNEFDILDLLNEYHSEMRKLKHKVDFVKSKINDLENELDAIKKRKDQERAAKKVEQSIDFQAPEEDLKEDEKPSAANELKVKTGPKKEAEKSQTSKPAEPIKVKGKPGRKPQPLSLWDQMIYDSVAEYGKAMLSKDIFDALKQKAIANGSFESDDKTKVKLNQCLVKMTSKRTDLIKVNHPGRGFAYAVPEWAGEGGKLSPEISAPSSKPQKPAKAIQKGKGIVKTESKGKRPRIKKTVPEKIATTSPKKP